MPPELDIGEDGDLFAPALAGLEGPDFTGDGDAPPVFSGIRSPILNGYLVVDVSTI